MNMVFFDQLGRAVEMDAPAKRIVSVVPSQTELLYHLGLEQEVAGITKFCIHPASWHLDKPRVGGTKRLNIEQIRRLAPDLILANREENTREELTVLMKEFPVWVSDIKRLEDALDMIRSVGRITAREEKANQMAREIASGFSSLEESVNPPLKVAYFIWHAPWMVAAHDTFIDDMLRRAGFTNCFGHLSRYPEVNPLEAKDALLLLSSEPFPFKEKHADALRDILPGCHIGFVDGELFSWYGSRLLEAPAYFRKLRQELESL